MTPLLVTSVAIVNETDYCFRKLRSQIAWDAKVDNVESRDDLVPGLKYKFPSFPLSSQRWSSSLLIDFSISAIYQPQVSYNSKRL